MWSNKLAPGNRIDARRGFIEEENVRLLRMTAQAKASRCLNPSGKVLRRHAQERLKLKGVNHSVHRRRLLPWSTP